MSSAIDEQKIVYNPTKIPWQLEFLRDKSLVILLEGSAGGGKSRAAGEKIHAYLSRYQSAFGLIVRKTRESLENSTVLFMRAQVIGPDPEVAYLDRRHRWLYNNGSMLAYGGMKDEGQREAIRGIGPDGALDFVWMEEAIRFTEDDYNEILARMRGKAAPWRQIVVSTNPGSPHHWIYKRLIVGGEAKVYRSRAADNPFNPSDYLSTLAKIGGTLGQRLREGRWVQAEGVIYKEFDESVHLIDSFPVPKEWKHFLAVDFGYEHPFVCQWWAIDHDGRMYRYREIYMTHRIVSEHAQLIKKCSLGESIPYAVCDHDAEDRATLDAAGIKTKPAEKAVSPGIQEVIERLRRAGDGKPRLFLMRNALVELDPWLVQNNLPTCTEEEITLYSWMQGSEGAVKDKPRKEFDHGLDCLRYMTMDRKRRQLDAATRALWSW